jgi:hypothetical protein
MTELGFSLTPQWRVTCPKHGDVTHTSWVVTKTVAGRADVERGYCLECVGEFFDAQGVPQVRGEWV